MQSPIYEIDYNGEDNGDVKNKFTNLPEKYAKPDSYVRPVRELVQNWKDECFRETTYRDNAMHRQSKDPHIIREDVREGVVKYTAVDKKTQYVFGYIIYSKVDVVDKNKNVHNGPLLYLVNNDDRMGEKPLYRITPNKEDINLIGEHGEGLKD
jgi:hypothetical protein